MCQLGKLKKKWKFQIIFLTTSLLIFQKKTKCKSVTKYKNEKYQKCANESYQKCDQVPKQDCKYETRNECKNERSTQCKDVPEQECKDVHFSVPKQVQKTVCDGDEDEYVNVEDGIKGDEDYDTVFGVKSGGSPDPSNEDPFGNEFEVFNVKRN